MGKHYKFDFKIKIVQEYLNRTQGYYALTKAYGLSSTSILRRWVDQYLKYDSNSSLFIFRKTLLSGTLLYLLLKLSTLWILKFFIKPPLFYYLKCNLYKYDELSRLN